jgi:hypothetical protein
MNKVVRQKVLKAKKITNLNQATKPNHVKVLTHRVKIAHKRN